MHAIIIYTVLQYYVLGGKIYSTAFLIIERRRAMTFMKAAHY